MLPICSKVIRMCVCVYKTDPYTRISFPFGNQPENRCKLSFSIIANSLLEHKINHQEFLLIYMYNNSLYYIFKRITRNNINRKHAVHLCYKVHCENINSTQKYYKLPKFIKTQCSRNNFFS